MANKRQSSLKQINRRYHAHMKAVAKGVHEKQILDSLTNGKNTYLRLDRLASSSFDKTWIDIIEGVIFDLGQIVQNPRLNTKTEGNIVPVELARKTNAESVQHLASHTQYIKEIDEYGNVIPSKILAMYHEDDIKTYENRFIATLIRRLVLFIEKRYELVSKLAELRDEEILWVKNKSFVDGAEVEIETKVKISHKNESNDAIKSTSYIERIKQIREYVLYFYRSEFMHQLRTEKDVHNPIMQTNIIRKNPTYHHCYEVYRFIESYNKLGVNYKVDENYSLFSQEDLKELNRTTFANYITLKGKDRSKNAKVDSRVYKPRILTSVDDESFIYGKLLNGPVEFVRMDPLYREYLQSKLRQDLPQHPTKAEKEFYADEYAARNENKQDEKQVQDLIRRRNKEVAEFEKQAARIDAEREAERLRLIQLEKDIIKKEEDEMLAEARARLIASSIEDQKVAEEIRRKDEEARYIAKLKEQLKIVPVPMSHPAQEPMTYEEAVLDIWPQTGNEVKHEFYKPAPKKPEIKVVPMSHPAQEPVTYEEAVLQIWPQAGKEVHHEFEKPVKYEPVKEEPKVEEKQPEIKVVPMSHPTQEPVTYDEAVKEIWPNSAKVVHHEFEKPVKQQPQKAEEAKVEEKPAPAPVAKPTGPTRMSISGKFLVRTPYGYYAGPDKYVATVKEAKMFDNYYNAHDIKKKLGGNVIKIS